MPAVVEAWKLAVTPENVIAGFRRTGIHPYDPDAWRLTSDREVTRLGGLPVMVTSPARLREEPRINALVQPHVDSLVEFTAAQAKDKCGQCGQTPKKAPSPRLSTEAGVMLTAERTRSEIQAIIDHRRDKKAQVEERKAAREAKRVAKAGTASKGKGRKRRAGEAVAEKENSEPNTAESSRAERSSAPARGENGLLCSPFLTMIAEAMREREREEAIARTCRVKVTMGKWTTVHSAVLRKIR